MRQKIESLAALFERIFGNKATVQEKELANRWFSQLDLHKEPVFSGKEEEEQIRKRMLTRLHAHISTRKKQVALRRFPAWTRRVAAMLLLAVLSTGVYFYFHSGSAPETYAAAAGGQAVKLLTLPDGTKVALNKFARLTWDSDFNGTQRRVSLSGEAFFDIKRDTTRPFILESGGILTTVLGTSFNVESYAGENQVRISLVRGRVHVQDRNKLQNQAELRPGQMVTYYKQGGRLEVKPIAVGDPGAWVNGKVVFNEIPLVSALERISANYGITLHYDAQQLQDKTVTASLERVSWKEALQAILFIHDLDYTIREKGEVMIE